MKKHGNEVKFKLTTILPSYVLGPQLKIDLSNGKLNLSSELINSIVHAREESQLPTLSSRLGYFIDVRDVAKAELLAFQKDECIGKRLSLTSGTFSIQRILNVIHKDFPELNGKVPVGAPDLVEESADDIFDFSNEETKKALGFEFIDFKTSVDDSTRQILDAERKN